MGLLFLIFDIFLYFFLAFDFRRFCVLEKFDMLWENVFCAVLQVTGDNIETHYLYCIGSCNVLTLINLSECNCQIVDTK